MDGIDFSLIKSDGKNKIYSEYNITYDYPQELKNDIKKLIICFNSYNFQEVRESQKYRSTEKKFENFLKNKVSLFTKRFNISNDTIQTVSYTHLTLPTIFRV